MAELSVMALWSALVSAGISTLCVVVTLIWSGAGRELSPSLVVQGDAVVAIPGGSANLARPSREAVITLGQFLSRATVVLLTAALVARGLAEGHAPWADFGGFLVAFADGALIYYAVVQRQYRHPALGAFLLPLVLAMLVAGAIFFTRTSVSLVPALQDEWLLVAHVGVMILAYGALTLSFSAALLYLVQGTRGRFARLPAPAVLDQLAYRSVIAGFPLLTLGIAIGAYWADLAWGAYWSWDPKESASLATWLAYGFCLHVHARRSWRGTPFAVMLLVAYGAVLFTYIGVNLIPAGLHSYGGA